VRSWRRLKWLTDVFGYCDGAGERRVVERAIGIPPTM
jgi:hypothetical protein